MSVAHDKYYKTENLFGKPYPELMEFFVEYPEKGQVRDLGCGQGRDAIALAQLGYTVTGIDNAKVGIEQMNQVANTENLILIGEVGDIYTFENFNKFDCLVVVCILDTGNKVQILNKAIDHGRHRIRHLNLKFKYIFEDLKTKHTSKSDYRMIIAEK